ncbi:TetR/AcrR family transcriptional regulator [Streptomyces sp. ICBB 8177]|uniref:TetR/AcrR family transcriptional regulator n=1 Tax=Streptomyces sp. ICBB 8177 TaxID=563922 RepID=UPI000D67B2F1|nr:TetR/AcrR family transcriptional regulator [Streptomyces sp. ICBB 8177]PWI42222.1 TetR family transcriptional regulator [Streptomyces sp. ICBB 8177]
MTTESGQAPARRTRLTPDREAKLYAAVLEELRGAGYEAMTMDAVAARARTSKATLYRQWKGKPQLVAAALRHLKPLHSAGIDTGSLRGDLLEIAHRVEQVAPGDTALLAAVGHACDGHPELGDAMRQALIEPERAVLDAMLERAVARGELRADAKAAEFFLPMLVAALPARKILEDRFADAAYMTRYIDAVVLPALLNS